MDLFKEWEKVNQEKFSTSTIKKEEIMKAISKESTLTINELRKRLKYKIYWALSFIVLFVVWFIFSLSYPTVLPLIGVILACYLFGVAALYNQYRKMSREVDMSDNTLDAMKKHVRLVKNALQFENYFGLVTFPIAVICGLILDELYAGQTILEALSQDQMAVKLVISMVVLVPLLHLGANMMNEKAYGSFIRKLDRNIGKLEGLM